MKDLFHFSLFERRGAFSLLAMALCLFLLPRWWGRRAQERVIVQVDIAVTQATTPDRPFPGSATLSDKPAEVSTGPGKTTTQEAAARIPINQADENQWATLRGIGPVLSGRIVRFRDKLGGFASIGQVGETYGLPDSVFQSIRHRLVLDQEHRKLRINQLSAEELAEHPYVNWRQAKAVVAYRQASGPFRRAEDFAVLRVFSEEDHQRIRPYLDFSIGLVDMQ